MPYSENRGHYTHCTLFIRLVARSHTLVDTRMCWLRHVDHPPKINCCYRCRRRRYRRRCILSLTFRMSLCLAFFIDAPHPSLSRTPISIFRKLPFSTIHFVISFVVTNASSRGHAMWLTQPIHACPFVVINPKAIFHNIRVARSIGDRYRYQLHCPAK